MSRKEVPVYTQIIEHIFSHGYRDGATSIEFSREDIIAVAQQLRVQVPRNIGDVVYSMRYRMDLPHSMIARQPQGMEWIIEGAGRSKYKFMLVPISRIVPNENLVSIKIPDATPEIILAYASEDEQGLLAKVRYNRLVDIFLGITAFSLQNHLRTTVAEVGQIEIDELYVGLDRRGCQYIVPVQAKSGTDKLSTVQSKQDIAYCRQKFPDLVCRPVSAQFIDESQIALFEFGMDNGSVKVFDEKHYRLVPADEITPLDMERYRQGS
jgi:hypothetical protein